jgi:ribosome-binding protein aMBF1 (putative translation factor)
MMRSRQRPIRQKVGKSSARKSLRAAKKPKNSGRKRRAKRQLSAKRARTMASKVRSRRSKRFTAHTAAELAAAIAGVRRNAGLSQGRLARAVKTDQANIVRLEKGRSMPSVRTLLRIGKAAGHKMMITFVRLGG